MAMSGSPALNSSPRRSVGCLHCAFNSSVAPPQHLPDIQPRLQTGPVTAFRERVPDAVNVRDMFEHFDAYVEGRGRRQADGQVGTSVGSWRPLISRGAECRVRIGPYEIEIATAAEASARLMNATQEAAESPGG